MFVRTAEASPHSNALLGADLNPMKCPRGYFRYSNWDALLVGAALLYGVVLFLIPSVVTFGFGVWWIGNTASHNFIHRPFFRSSTGNHLFSAYLTILLGVPQRLWSDRHQAHHADADWKMRWSRQLTIETAALATFWLTLFLLKPQFFWLTYLPGWALGMLLCSLQGYFEHYRGTSISYYGTLYNLLFFNDGFHSEHHLNPTRHWRALPHSKMAKGEQSTWPSVLRFVELCNLDGLEKVVLRSTRMQKWVVGKHRRAFERVLPKDFKPRCIGIVGGGLFPRTALIIRELFPQAELCIIDANEAHIASATKWLGQSAEYVHSRFELVERDFDLITIPLAYRGDRQRFYGQPPAELTIVHDWIWRRVARSTVVSWFLFKRINVLRKCDRLLC